MHLDKHSPEILPGGIKVCLYFFKMFKEIAREIDSDLLDIQQKALSQW